MFTQAQAANLLAFLRPEIEKAQALGELLNIIGPIANPPPSPPGSPTPSLPEPPAEAPFNPS